MLSFTPLKTLSFKTLGGKLSLPGKTKFEDISVSTFLSPGTFCGKRKELVKSVVKNDLLFALVLQLSWIS